MYCTWCGAELEADAMFCGRCGKKILVNHELTQQSPASQALPQTPSGTTFGAEHEETESGERCQDDVDFARIVHNESAALAYEAEAQELIKTLRICRIVGISLALVVCYLYASTGSMPIGQAIFAGLTAFFVPYGMVPIATAVRKFGFYFVFGLILFVVAVVITSLAAVVIGPIYIVYARYQIMRKKELAAQCRAA